MEFTSQICTTKEQSERLLALGLKKETADMGIVKSTNEIYVGCPTDYSFENGLHIPAWSLHRLIEIYDKTCIFWTESWDNPYDAMIGRIANKIKCGELNKEYLEGLWKIFWNML